MGHGFSKGNSTHENIGEDWTSITVEGNEIKCEDATVSNPTIYPAGRIDAFKATVANILRTYLKEAGKDTSSMTYDEMVDEVERINGGGR